jgi:5-methylcytosine-specific restriction endonuclease McrA
MFDRKAADARYRNKDRAAYNARIAAWKKAHPRRARAHNLAYKKTHKAEVTAYNAQYRLTHAEELAKYNAEYYQAHPEEYRERLSNWRKENPERAKIQIHTRRTRKTQAGGSYTEQEWLELRKKYGNRCLCCNKRRVLVPDHVIPVVKGGSSNIENIQPLCQPCNSRKSARTTDFRLRRPQHDYRYGEITGENDNAKHRYLHR